MCSVVHRQNHANKQDPDKRVVENFMEYKYGPWLGLQKNRVIVFGECE
jgi:hypothetical protein